MNDFIFANRTKIYFGKDLIQHFGEEVAHVGKACFQCAKFTLQETDP